MDFSIWSSAFLFGDGLAYPAGPAAEASWPFPFHTGQISSTDIFFMHVRFYTAVSYGAAIPGDWCSCCTLYCQQVKKNWAVDFNQSRKKLSWLQAMAEMLGFGAISVQVGLCWDCLGLGCRPWVIVRLMYAASWWFCLIIFFSWSCGEGAVIACVLVGAQNIGADLQLLSQLRKFIELGGKNRIEKRSGRWRESVSSVVVNVSSQQVLLCQNLENSILQAKVMEQDNINCYSNRYSWKKINVLLSVLLIISLSLPARIA